jgi:hypothetical protein
MKRVIYIAFVMVGLLVVSCSKENIRPVSTERQEAPIWRSSSSAPETGGVVAPGPGSITDPNNDDETGKRKRQ